jgi:hypothetical protein
MDIQVVLQVRKPFRRPPQSCSLSPTAGRAGAMATTCAGGSLKAGTVYPILRRLAEHGQVETTWETNPPPGRPARHLYRLSKAGGELAEELRKSTIADVPRTRSPGSHRPALGEAL